MFELLDVTGTLVFAISGALTAVYKKLDLFGVYCIAFVTALGGGTVRDVMIGRDRKSTRLNSSHLKLSRMPSSA